MRLSIVLCMILILGKLIFILVLLLVSIKVLLCHMVFLIEVVHIMFQVIIVVALLRNHKVPYLAFLLYLITILLVILIVVYLILIVIVSSEVTLPTLTLNSWMILFHDRWGEVIPIVVGGASPFLVYESHGFVFSLVFLSKCVEKFTRIERMSHFPFYLISMHVH